MKYISLFILVSFITCTTVHAQPGSGRISGIVKDAVQGVLLESATLIIYKPDSTVLLFKLSDKNGRYEISGLPMKGKYILAASFAGYQDYRRQFTMDVPVKKMDTIFLQTKTSDEVVITTVAPIRMNGDTLEINPAAFKLANDAVAEDLLNKVPGIVVWADGSITMNGKTIPKVLVDGKPFLGNSDHRLATQNLPKNVIDKIQVYNEVDQNSEANRTRMTDPNAPKDSLLTLDIRLKADKKNGYFGKYGGGIGTGNRYQAELALQLYNKRSSIAAGGGANNINADIADLSEIQRESSFRNNYSTYRNRSNFGRNGINRIIAPGIQFMHSFSPTDNERMTNRITGGYDYNNNAGQSISQTYQERYLKEGDQLINSFSNSNSHNEQHVVRINYNKNLDYNKRFGINVSGRNSSSYSESTTGSVIANRQGKLISDRAGNTSNASGGRSFNAAVNYSNYDYENPLKAIDASANFSRSENSSDRNENSSYNFYGATGTNNTTVKRHYNKESGSTNFNAALNYRGLKRLFFGRFNFFGIDIATNHTVTYRKDEDVNNVFDIDASQKENANRNLTYTETFSSFQYVPSLSMNKSFSKWSSRSSGYWGINASVNKQFTEENNSSSRSNRNISRTFSFVRFNAGANFSRQVTEAYRMNGGLNYQNDYGYPSINQIAPVVDSLNLYSIYKGGLNLVNSKSHSISGNVNYSTNKTKKPTQFSAGLNGSFNNVLLPYVDSSLNLRDTTKGVNGLDSVYLNGKQVRYTINGNRRYNAAFGYSTSFSRKVKGNQVQLQYNGNFNMGMMPSYIDNIYTIINTSNFSHNLRFTYYYKTILITGVGANASYNNSRQTGYKNSKFNTRTLSGNFDVTVNITKNASIASNLSYSKNNGILKPITIWNGNATYRFLKSKQAEVKFTATDILKQFRNISYTANADGVTSSVSNGLQQYFMVTLSYFPRKFGGGDGKRSGANRGGGGTGARPANRARRG